MPPEAAAAAAPATVAAPPPAVVIPPADQPPAPSKPASFQERWAAVESQVDDSIDEPTAAPEAGKPAPPKAAPKQEAKSPTDDKEAKREQLKALATELGMVLDDSGISTKDAIEVRAAKRRNLEWKAQQEAEFAKREQEFKSTHGTKLERAAAILDAYERGDPEGFAKALGEEDFNAYQASWLKRLQDPNYRELKALQERAKKEDERKAQEAEAAQKTAAEQRRAEVYRGYMTSLAEQCKASQHPLAREMADDPAFLRDIYRIQEENWDEETQRTVTLDEAIKRSIKGANVSLEDWHKKQYERYRKIYGPLEAPESPAPAPASAAPKNGKKPAPKTAVVPSTSTPGSSAPKKPGDMSREEWRRYANSKLNEAQDD